MPCCGLVVLSTEPMRAPDRLDLAALQRCASFSTLDLTRAIRAAVAGCSQNEPGARHRIARRSANRSELTLTSLRPTSLYRLWLASCSMAPRASSRSPPLGGRRLGAAWDRLVANDRGFPWALSVRQLRHRAHGGDGRRLRAHHDRDLCACSPSALVSSHAVGADPRRHARDQAAQT